MFRFSGIAAAVAACFFLTVPCVAAPVPDAAPAAGHAAVLEAAPPAGGLPAPSAGAAPGGEGGALVQDGAAIGGSGGTASSAGVAQRPGLRAALEGFLSLHGRETEACAVAALLLLSLLEIVLAVTERSHARFAAGLFLSAASAQAVFSLGAWSAILPAWAVPAGRLAAVAAMVLLPQVGRVFLRTAVDAPVCDGLLLAISPLCACLGALTLVPSLSWTAGWIQLWPLAAMLCIPPVLVPCIRGASCSFMFLLALAALGAGGGCGLLARLQPGMAWLAPCLPAALAAAAFLLAGASPLKQGAGACDDAGLLPVDEDEEDDETGGDSSGEGRRLGEEAARLLDEACRFDQVLGICADEDVRGKVGPHADAMVAAARRLACIATGASGPVSGPEPEAVASSENGRFDLRRIISGVFSTAARNSPGGGLSWFVSPLVGNFFEGDGARLAGMLEKLVLEAMRASRGGSASLRVSPSPEGLGGGMLRFSVTDGGGSTGVRNLGTLAGVLAEASASGASVGVVSGPGGGTVFFDMGFRPADEPAGEAGLPVIFASPDGPGRALVRHHLSGMGLDLREVRTAGDAALLRRSVSAVLVILDGLLDASAMAEAVADVRNFEGGAGLPPVRFLLLARDGGQNAYMKQAGCDDSVPVPLVRRDLRAMVRWLVAPAGTLPRPVPSARRITVGGLMSGDSVPDSMAGFRKKERGAAVFRMERGNARGEGGAKAAACVPGDAAGACSAEVSGTGTVPPQSASDSDVSRQTFPGKNDARRDDLLSFDPPCRR